LHSYSSPLKPSGTRNSLQLYSTATPRASRFYERADFHDNRCDYEDGGAVDNLGDLK